MTVWPEALGRRPKPWTKGIPILSISCALAITYSFTIFYSQASPSLHPGWQLRRANVQEARHRSLSGETSPLGFFSNGPKVNCCSVAQEHGIPLIKVDSNMKLGEWAGLCKIDQEGKARKVVKCSAAVVGIIISLGSLLVLFLCHLSRILTCVVSMS